MFSLCEDVGKTPHRKGSDVAISDLPIFLWKYPCLSRARAQPVRVELRRNVGISQRTSKQPLISALSAKAARTRQRQAYFKGSVYGQIALLKTPPISQKGRGCPISTTISYHILNKKSSKSFAASSLRARAKKTKKFLQKTKNRRFAT